MTDFTGTEEPRRTDDLALEEPAPVIPAVPGAAGLAAPAVIVAAGPVDETLAAGEPHSHDGGPSHSHAHPHEDEHGPEGEGHGGLVEGIGDAIRGLFGRGDKSR